jgi:hypothetical protein
MYPAAAAWPPPRGRRPAAGPCRGAPARNTALKDDILTSTRGGRSRPSHVVGEWVVRGYRRTEIRERESGLVTVVLVRCLFLWYAFSIAIWALTPCDG